MSRFLSSLTIALLGATLLGQAQAALPQHPDLDLAAAQRLAQAAPCSAALAVLDRSGQLILLQRDTRVGPHNAEAARRKAFTALSTRTPSQALAERARQNPDAANLVTLPELLLLGGGIPLYEGDQLVGALGIAGAGGGGADERCALAAAEHLNLTSHP